jgi:hypothetical protein
MCDNVLVFFSLFCQVAKFHHKKKKVVNWVMNSIVIHEQLHHKYAIQLTKFEDCMSKKSFLCIQKDFLFSLRKNVYLKISTFLQIM